MENENNEAIIDSQNDNEGAVTIDNADAENAEVEKVEEKKETPKESPEDRVSRLERQLKRARKEAGLEPESKQTKTQSSREQKSSDLDYGEKAFLRSYDIKGADEIALIKKWVERTGDPLDVAVEDEIFQAKLTSLRTARASADAIPKGNRRNTQPLQNDEQYWTSKIESGQAELKDITDSEMRIKVLNKRIEKEKNGSKFSPNGIIMT